MWWSETWFRGHYLRISTLKLDWFARTNKLEVEQHRIVRYRHCRPHNTPLVRFGFRNVAPAAYGIRRCSPFTPHKTGRRIGTTRRIVLGRRLICEHSFEYDLLTTSATILSSLTKKRSLWQQASKVKQKHRKHHISFRLRVRQDLRRPR